MSDINMIITDCRLHRYDHHKLSHRVQSSKHYHWHHLCEIIYIIIVFAFVYVGSVASCALEMIHLVPDNHFLYNHNTIYHRSC
jgi:hypothetical protein